MDQVRLSPGTPDGDGLAVQAEEEWGRLRNQLELASGFWLGFLLAPSPAPVKALLRRTEQLLRLRARRTLLIEPSRPSELHNVLPELFADGTKDAGCVWVSAIHADSDNRTWDAEWEHLLLRMNERRDALRRHLGGGLVLAAYPTVKVLAREAAPDLWSVRSLVLELETVVAAFDHAGPSRHIARSEREPSAGSWSGLRLSDTTVASSVPRMLDAVDANLSAGRNGDAVSSARMALEQVESDQAYAGDLPIVLAWLSRAEEAAGDYPAALEHAGRALTTPGDMTDALGLELLDRTGELAGRLNDAERSLDAFRRMVGEIRRIGGDRPDPYDLRLLSTGLDRLGEAYLRAGQGGDAIAAFEEALAVDRERAGHRSAGGEELRDLSISLERLGDARMAAGDLVGATSAFRESLALRPASGPEPASQEAIRDRAVALDKLGDALLRAGDVAAATASYEAGQALHQRMVDADPSNDDALNAFATSLDRVGDVHFSAGNTSGASDAYGRSLAVRRATLARGGEGPDALRRVEASLVRVGDAALSRGDVAAATDAYEESLAAARRLLESHGESPAFLRDAAVSLGKLADARLAAGDPAAALALFTESVALARRAIHLYGLDPEVAHDLSVSLERLGDIRLGGGDIEGATKAFDESLELRRQLVDLYGPVPSALRDVSEILRRIVDVRTKAGLAEEAEAAAKEAVAIDQQLGSAR